MNSIYTCPVCGRLIVPDYEDKEKLIVIRTKRRSTVLVHKTCASSTQKEETK